MLTRADTVLYDALLPAHARSHTRTHTYTDNYIEDFGKNATHCANPTTVLNTTYYGIRCTVQGGAASVIRHNKIFQFGSEKPGAYRSGARFVFIGVDKVNYGTGQMSVVGNTLRKDNGTAADIGLAYAVREAGSQQQERQGQRGVEGQEQDIRQQEHEQQMAHARYPTMKQGNYEMQRHGRYYYNSEMQSNALGLELVSESNHVQLGPEGVSRLVDPAVIMVAPL